VAGTVVLVACCGAGTGHASRRLSSSRHLRTPGSSARMGVPLERSFYMDLVRVTMSTRLRLYAAAGTLVLASYWCNNLANPDHRRLLGALLIVLSFAFLEWVIRAVAREALRQAARGAGQ
jgi:hypothetical protein